MSAPDRTPPAPSAAPSDAEVLAKSALRLGEACPSCGFQYGWGAQKCEERECLEQRVIRRVESEARGAVEAPMMIGRTFPALWNAINSYADACGGNTGAANISERRMCAVTAVESALRSLLAARSRRSALEPEGDQGRGRMSARDVVAHMKRSGDEFRKELLAQLGASALGILLNAKRDPRGWAGRAVESALIEAARALGLLPSEARRSEASRGEASQLRGEQYPGLRPWESPGPSGPVQEKGEGK